MPVAEIGDPRLQALFGANDTRDSGVRPTVRLPRRGLPPIAIGIGAITFAVLLFLVLNARRTSQEQPSVRSAPTTNGVTAWAPPPALYIPPAPAPVLVPEPVQPKAAPPIAQPAPAPRTSEPRAVYQPQPIPQMAQPLPPPGPPPRVSSGSPLVIDSGTAPGVGANPERAGSPFPRSGEGATRMRASALANRSMTVPQGSLIPAVLETGFDSTKPGFARAIVSRDVRGFDGRNVLIPRGSRLIGEYHADVAQGQKRAVIGWTRLIRPDGMTITLDSPAVDTLGRGGVPAHVDTHFLARVGDALLQSTVGIGSALAQRSVTGPVVVVGGSPISGAAQTAGPIVPTNNYVPTLTVPAGKSISIFVAHDLDFGAAGTAG